MSTAILCRATSGHAVKIPHVGRLRCGLRLKERSGYTDMKVQAVSQPAMRKTIEKYGEGQGHYVQSQALGFFELSSGSFEDFVFENDRVPERSIMRRHMDSNTAKTLYVCDAGYNGMAFIAISEENEGLCFYSLVSCGFSFLHSNFSAISAF